MNCHLDQGLVDEGLAREIVNRIQTLRKTSNLFQSQQVVAHVNYVTPGSALASVLQRHKDLIETSTNVTIVMEPLENPKFEGEWVIKDDKLKVALVF